MFSEAAALLHLSFTPYFKLMKNNSETYKTILVIVVGLSFISYIFKLDLLLKCTLVMGLACALSGWAAEKISWLWMKLTWVLSKIMPNIILSGVFYLFLTPLALLSRTFGEKNPLMLKNPGQSTFKKKEDAYSKESLEKMW